MQVMKYLATSSLVTALLVSSLFSLAQLPGQADFEKADKFYSEGKNEEAIAELYTALSNGYDYETCFAAMFTIEFEAMGRHEEALKRFEEAVASNPSNESMQFHLAVIYGDHFGDADRMGAQIEKCIHQFNVSDRMIEVATYFYRGSGRFFAVERMFDAMQKKDPDNINLIVGYAVVEFEEGLKLAEIFEPDSMTYEQGYYAREKYIKCFNKCEDLLIKGKKKEPNNVQIAESLVSYYQMLGETEKLEEATSYQHLVRERNKPENKDIYSRAVSANVSDRFDEAVELYERCLLLEIDPKGCYTSLLWLYKSDLKDDAKTLDLLERAVKQFPKESDFHKQRVRILLDLAYTQRAYDAINSWLDEFNWKNEIDATIVNYARLSNNIEQTKYLFERRSSSQSSRFYSARTIGSMYMDLAGDASGARRIELTKEAIIWLEKADTEISDSKLTLTYLSLAYMYLGEVSKSEQYQTRADTGSYY
jgi:tetratricopeptide (TPR) repeat protein